MSESKRGYSRRNYFIEKKFQSNFILKFCSLVALGGLLTIGIIYFLASRSTTVSIINSRVMAHSTADFLLPLLIQTVLIVVIIVSLATIAVTLMFSHKIAGPLFRFKKSIKTLEEGDFSAEFHTRHLDQLKELNAALNSMVVKVREQLNLLKLYFTAFNEKLNNLSDGDVSEHKRANLGDLKRITEELNKIVRYFKS